MSEFVSLIEEDIHPLKRSKSATGTAGEKVAAEFLAHNGYRIVMANFTAPIGRNSKGVQIKGEIDIVALDDETLCFIEVKTRAVEGLAATVRSVDLRKQRLVTRTARVYRRVFALGEMQRRYDVVTVVGGEVMLYKGFWTESKFRKRIWTSEMF